jgi:hypothetical protein
MIQCFLEKAPTPDRPGYQFLFLIVETDVSYIGILIYKDFSISPIISGLQTVYRDIEEQLENILNLFQKRGLLVLS